MITADTIRPELSIIIGGLRDDYVFIVLAFDRDRRSVL